MSRCATDQELFRLIRTSLATSQISDVMGQLNCGFPMLPAEIRPLQPDMVVVGRAMPVRDEPPLPDGAPEQLGTKPFGLLFESIEALRQDEVYVASGGPIDAARLGDMLARRAQKLGAAGAIINAHVRDAKGILACNFPVFSRGPYAYGLQGRHNVVDFRCAIDVGKVRINPGDLIFADYDGVCVIPREAEEEIICKAVAKSEKERAVHDDIESGSSVHDAFKGHGVM